MKHLVLLLFASLLSFCVWYAEDDLEKRDQDLEINQEELDRAYEKEVKIFSKFTLDFPLKFASQVADTNSPALRFYQKLVFNTIKYTLPLVENKTDYLNFFYAFVDYPHNFNVMDLSHYVFSDLFNRHKARYSSYSFKQVLQHIQKYPLYQRMFDREFAEHSSIIHFNPYILQEYAIWDFLMGVISSFQDYSDHYRGLRVLKAWDTHWQEFAQIKSPKLNLITFPETALMLKNKSLYLTFNLHFPNEREDDDHRERLLLATLTFSLQKDHSRKLYSCSLKDPKIRSQLCKNPNIQITTILK